MFNNSPKFPANYPLKVLLIRVSSLGDVLHNMPIVADIAQLFPNAQIDWVVEENYVDLVALNKRVHNIIPFALRRWRKGIFKPAIRAEMADFKRKLQAVKYDLILETQGLLKTGVIMGLAQGRLKIGLANGTEGSGYEALSRLFHTQSIAVDKRTHAVLRGRIVTAAALNMLQDKVPQNTPTTAPYFGLSAPQFLTPPTWLPTHHFVVFFHGTAGAHKKWASENWIQVGNALNSHPKTQDWPILLAWGNEVEKQEAEHLAAHIKGAQVLPKLTMMQAVLLAQKASLVIGVDTGLTHIAAAYYRPTIEIYSATPKWKTEGNWSNSIINCGDKNQPPNVQDVLAAVEVLLGQDKDATLNTIQADF